MNGAGNTCAAYVPLTIRELSTLPAAHLAKLDIRRGGGLCCIVVEDASTPGMTCRASCMTTARRV